MKCCFLLNEELRQGPLYHLVEWNQADQMTKELLSGMQNDPEIYGIFQPAVDSPGLTVKAAYREVAMLYLHLDYSNKLPHYFTSSGTPNNNETIARLILDKIIEIKWNNNFVSGAAALTAIYGDSIFEDTEIPDYLSGLSMQAIHYAWMLQDQDLKSLANKLYTFNSVPWDSSVRSSFLSKHEIKKFLFPQTDEALKKQLESDWFFIETSEKRGWLSWVCSSKRSANALEPSYKLYISPHIQDLPDVIMKSIPLLSASEAISFKTGSTLQGLLRPDKMVVYFENPTALFQTAGLLENELEGYHPQGVPFSAQLDKSGLLSHGVDPPESEILDLIEGGSWRTTITDHLARAIIQAKTDKLNWQQSIAFIRASLSAAGIDSRNWMARN